jgi:methionyl-tRNA synthetase
MGKFYVTTPIYYVNGEPHIGHAYTSTAADVLARWHRLRGDETFLLTGTDENTLKLVKKAEEENTTPQKVADRYSARFEKLTTLMEISNDDFIRTTDEQKHHPGAQEIWKRLEAGGYIYKGTYEGLYCVDCETYYTEKDLVDGNCPIHGTEPEKLREENYFFKLSSFTEQVGKVIASGEFLITPESRKNEILSLIEAGLEDISCSRPADKLTMGVPVPGDDSQRMYVWFEALTNYLNGVGFPKDQKQFETFWPADVHVIGKEILRFHAAVWPAMLIAAKLPLPKHLYVHGFFNVEGTKMSKSLGNVVDPFEVAQERSADALRYYLLTALPYVSDGDYSDQRFTDVYNSQLANDLGNLASRVLTLVEKRCDGNVPQGETDQALHEAVQETHESLDALLAECKFADALVELNGLVSEANQFIGEKEPYKQEGKELETSLYSLVQVLGHLSLLYAPVIPETAGTLQGWLGLNGDGWTPESLVEWEKVPPGAAVTKGDPLFPKR